MTANSVVTVPPDSRFTFVPDSRGARIFSGQKNYIGKIVFDPSKNCRDDDNCYTGFSVKSKCEY